MEHDIWHILPNDEFGKEIGQRQVERDAETYN